MTSQLLIPIVVGVGDIVNRSTKTEDAIEPRKLMVDAIRKAVDDTGASGEKLISSIDSVNVVPTWTWPYDNLPDLIAQDLGLPAGHRFQPKSHGGNQPAALLDEAAKRITTGQSTSVVICGGEALASLAACAKQGVLPPPGWTAVSQDVQSVFSPTTRELETGLGAAHRIGAPIHVYPLYENAFRAHRKQSSIDNNRESAELYGAFAKVAQDHPLAWNYRKPAETAASIGTVSKGNRMICFPYPLLMNAFNTVNIAGACILTSTKHARELGIPEKHWIYPLGGAGTRDSYSFWERPNYYSSPSISRSLDAALKISGLAKEDIDLYDFYSCFPIVPKLACHYLELNTVNPAKPITLLGGLTSFGGAGNNYSMHALTEMVRSLRSGDGTTGLVLANGGMVTYQHVVCLSTSPRKDGSQYPVNDSLPEFITDEPIPQITSDPEGEAVIETYTVEFGRDGQPVRGHIVGRLKSNDHRFLANHGDEITLKQLVSMEREPVGRAGHVRRDPKTKGRNVFVLSDSAKL